MKIPDLTSGINAVIPKVYDDAVSPVAKEMGKIGETLVKTISTALLPLRILIWKGEEIEKAIKEDLEKKLINTSEENIQTPDPRIAGPVFEGLRYTIQEKELREMYTSLLANTMKKDMIKYVHPSFAEIIKQLEPDEARILEYLKFAKKIAKIDIQSIFETGGYVEIIKNYSKLSSYVDVINKEKIEVYLNNLQRLSLISIPYGIVIANKEVYKELTQRKYILNLKENYEKRGKKIKYIDGIIELTPYGREFCKCCIDTLGIGIGYDDNL